jgi:holliday junction DNA helicase RuvB
MSQLESANLSVDIWDNFVGQRKLKERLHLHIQAARKDNRAMEHVLLHGPPGFGKTSLARLIARELGDPLTEALAPSLTSRGLLRLLINFEFGVLHLDEVHALGRAQELLLSVLQDGFVQDERGRQYNIPWITLVASTTERDKILPPLYDRFKIIPEFEPYSEEDLAMIIGGMATKLELELDDDTLLALGRASCGVPRNAERLVLAARGLTVTDRPVTAEAILSLCGVEPDGLTALHLRHLETLFSQGGIAGEKTLAVVLQIPPASMRQLERLLVERTYIEYTASGRVLTPDGRRRIRPPDRMRRE